MIERGNPVAIEALMVPSTPELEKQIEQLIVAIKATDRDNIGWLRKQRELVRLRIGYRKPKALPWKGASNISVPLIDGVIRRYKPGMVALVLDADPIAYFTAQESSDFDPARVVEPFFTYLFREYMDTTFSVVQLVDTLLWRGHAYAREGWDYRTRKDARVVQVSQIFPEGLEQLAQAVQQANLQGQEITIEQVIMERLSQEYDISMEGPEGEMLMQAAARILEGAEYVRVVYRRVVCDKPSWQVLDPINVIAPQNQNPETGEFFTIIHYLTPDEIRAMAIDGYLLPNRVETLLQKAKRQNERLTYSTDADTERGQIRDVMDAHAGMSDALSGSDVGKIVVWETYCLLDIDGDGERERCVLWHAPQAGDDSRTGLSLGLMDFPYPFDIWPITYFPFEGAKRPLDNRGVAELLRPHQKVVNAHHNARIDATQILLAPVLVQRSTGGNYKQSIDWRPGGVIPVTNMGDVQPLVQDLRILSSLLQEEQSEQRLAETFIGVYDATLTNLQQSRERRTATEVQAVQSISSSIFGLDAKIFQTAFSKSLNKVWALYDDLGPDELFFRVSGEQKPRLARKVEISKKYDIRAAGTPANTARSFQLQNLERFMQVAMNPLVLQSGRIDFARMFEQWMRLVDYNAAKDIIRPPEEATAVQTVLQAAQAATGEEAPPF